MTSESRVGTGPRGFCEKTQSELPVEAQRERGQVTGHSLPMCVWMVLSEKHKWERVWRRVDGYGGLSGMDGVRSSHRRLRLQDEDIIKPRPDGGASEKVEKARVESEKDAGMGSPAGGSE